jgi:hypothetical protein
VEPACESLSTIRSSKMYQRFTVNDDLTTFPSGQKLLDAEPSQAVRNILAAAVQVDYWQEGRYAAHDARERAYLKDAAAWSKAHRIESLCKERRLEAQMAIVALMRRALPFQSDELLTLVRWCCKERVVAGVFPVIRPSCARPCCNL